MYIRTVPVTKKLKYLVTGSLPVRSRFGRGSVAVRSGFGRGSVGESGTVRLGTVRCARN